MTEAQIEALIAYIEATAEAKIADALDPEWSGSSCSVQRMAEQRLRAALAGEPPPAP